MTEDNDKVELARERRAVLAELERLTADCGGYGTARLLARFARVEADRVVYRDPVTGIDCSAVEAVAAWRAKAGLPEPSAPTVAPTRPSSDTSAAERWSALEAQDDADRKARLAAKAAAAPPQRPPKFRDEVSADELHRRAEREEAAAIAARKALR